MKRKINIFSLAAVPATAVLWSLVYLFAGIDFHMMTGVMIFLITLAALITRKAFMPAEIMITGSFIIAAAKWAANIPFNYKLLAMFAIIGIAFSALSAMTMKWTEMRAWLTVLIGAVSGALVPWVLGAIIKADIENSMISMIDSTLSYLFIGLLAGAIAYIVWYCIRENKTFLRIQHKR